MAGLQMFTWWSLNGKCGRQWALSKSFSSTCVAKWNGVRKTGVEFGLEWGRDVSRNMEVLQQRKNTQLWMLLTSWSLKKITTHVYEEMSHWRRVIEPDRQMKTTAVVSGCSTDMRTSARHRRDHLCLLTGGMCVCIKSGPLLFGVIHLRALKNRITAVGKCQVFQGCLCTILPSSVLFKL